MSSLTPVDTVTPIAPWVGGKRSLAKRLCNRIADIDHTTYAEPFVGMGGVFFRRSVRPKAEFINDASGEVVNLFRILQRHYPQFVDTIKFQITSRREFDRLKKCDPETLTDLERAARFLYLQRTAFGGKVTGQSFGIAMERPSRFNLSTLVPMLEDVHDRLAGVTLENLDWLEFIDRYDRPGTLFYIDPPYWGTEKIYGKELFDRAQFTRLADRLKHLKGRFILSINDRPEIRELFRCFNLEEVSLNYTVSNQNTMKAAELIISN